MSRILVIGAGRSSSTMIKYLLDNSSSMNCKVRVGDMDTELAQKITNDEVRMTKMQMWKWVN